MLFHDAIAQALAEHGVTTVFGVLGDANLYMMDSFQRNAGGHYYSASNENGAVLAANGYARTSGQLGVCTVTHGPAFTNTLTALTQGVREHTPLLLLAGDTPAAERANLQDIAQRPVALAAGAGFVQVRAPQTVFEDLATAIQRAWSESRPIVLNVPVDFQWEDIEYQSVPSRLIGAQAVRPDPSALDAAVGIIASARRPVVLAGWGATSPDARAALLRLADRLGAPVATTLRGKGLFTGERFNLGIHGTLAHAVALDTLNSSDCLIAFGAGLNRWTTADGSLLAKKRVVQVDVSRDSINRWAVADAGVIGDAAITADTIVTMLDEAGVKPTGFASPELAERLAAGTQESFTDRSTDESVDLRTALDMIDRAFPADRTLVLDIGRFIRHGLTRLSAPEPSAFVHTLDFGAIGLGMPTAVGACVRAARPPRPDGGRRRRVHAGRPGRVQHGRTAQDGHGGVRHERPRLRRRVHPVPQQEHGPHHLHVRLARPRPRRHGPRRRGLHRAQPRPNWRRCWPPYRTGPSPCWSTSSSTPPCRPPTPKRE